MPDDKADKANEGKVAEFEAQLQAERAKIAEIVAERDRYKKDYRSIKDTADALAAKEAEREVAAIKLKEEAEQKALLAKGEFEKALALEKARYNSDVAERDSILNGLVEKQFIPAHIKAAVQEAGLNVTPEALADIPRLTAGMFTYDLKTQSLQVTGKADADPKLELSEFIKARPYLLKDTMARSTGLRPADGGKRGNSITFAQALSNPAVAEEWKKSDPEGYAAAQKEYNSPSMIYQRAKDKLKK